MKKITLLAPVALLGLGFTLTSCGDKISPESISFNSYSKEVTQEEFVEEYKKLTAKSIDAYTLNSYTYDKYDAQFGDVSSYMVSEKKETKKFDKNVNKYSYSSNQYSFSKEAYSYMKGSSKEDYYFEIEEDEDNYTYSRVYGNKYDNVEMTYEEYSLRVSDIIPEITPKYITYVKTEFLSNVDAKFYIDDDLYTIVAKYKSASDNTNKKDITNVQDSSGGYKYEYKFQIKIGEKEVFMKYQLTDESSYETTTDNKTTKYKYSKVSVYSYEYNLEAPVFNEIDKTKYINVD